MSVPVYQVIPGITGKLTQTKSVRTLYLSLVFQHTGSSSLDPDSDSKRAQEVH